MVAEVYLVVAEGYLVVNEPYSPNSGGSRRASGASRSAPGDKKVYLVVADLVGSKAVESRALLAGVRSRIHMPAIKYSMVSSWLVRPISSASMAKQLLSRAAACTQPA